MWEEEENKSQSRNQLVGLALTMLMFILFIQFYGGFTTPPEQPADETAVEQSTAIDAEGNPVEPPMDEETAAVTEESGSEWPYLPPVAEQSDPDADLHTLSDEGLELVFTAVGARLKYARILDTIGADVQLVPQPEPDPESGEELADADAMYPLGLHFTNEAIGDELDRRRWERTAATDDSVTYAITLPNAAVITKTFQLAHANHLINVSVSYENLESEPRLLGRDHIPAYALTWGPDVTSGDENKQAVPQQFVWRLGEENETLQTGKLEINEDGSPHEQFIGNINGYPEWLAVRSAYFLVGFKPEFEGAQAWLWGYPEFFRFGFAVPSQQVEPGETHTAEFKLYAGPSEQKELAAAWPTLDTALVYFNWFGGVMNPFAKFLLSMLNWFYSMVPNYGIAIILLTVVVRLVMVPLTVKQMRSMKQMQLLQPEVEALREKYKDDPQEQSRKMMEMYRERGVNPLGGCFPVLLQMPIFFALYRMLWVSYELRGAPFVLWIDDLSEPDRLFEIPGVSHIPIQFLAEHFQYFNVLPILSAITMLMSFKLMPMTGAQQNPQQKMIMNIMPVVFSLICYNFAAGLNLYIFVSTGLGIVQSRLVNRGDVKLPEKKELPKKRKTNPYAAAQARKKRVAKELKAAKKRNGPQSKKDSKSPPNKQSKKK